jgi:hypothetical protein
MDEKIKALVKEFWGAIQRKDYSHARKIMARIKALLDERRFYSLRGDMGFVLKNIMEKRQALGGMADTGKACANFFWFSFACFFWLAEEQKHLRIVQAHIDFLHNQAGSNWTVFSSHELKTLAAGAAFLAMDGDEDKARQIVSGLKGAPDPVIWVAGPGAAGASGGDDPEKPGTLEPTSPPESEPEPEQPRKRMRM